MSDKKISNQAAEIAILNKRLSEAMRKLKIITESDRIKYELAHLVKNCSFRQAIDSPANREEIERIFGEPYEDCLQIYESLLTKRNILVHRYTARDWKKPSGRVRHGTSIKKLCSTLKTYELLQMSSVVSPTTTLTHKIEVVTNDTIESESETSSIASVVSESDRLSSDRLDQTTDYLIVTEVDYLI